MPKQEDELAIDFSKITGRISSFFKTKEKPEHPGHHKAEKQTGHEKGEEEKSSDDEISIDVKKIWKFIVKYKTILILLIPLFFAVFVRIHPFYLPATDVWAKNTVDNYYKTQIMQQINQQYPNLPQENKEVIANENLQKMVNENKDTYQQQISQVSQNFKSQFQDETGQTYLMELDCWHWYRYTKNIIDHGYPGDYIGEDGIMIDDHMVAPLGNKVGKEIYPYIGAYFHKILNFFDRNISLQASFFLLPVILSALAVIPAFLIGRKIGGDVGGLFTGMFMAVHPAILNRTIAGFSDTDANIILITMLCFWLFVEAFDSENRKNAIIYSVLAGISLGIFALAWYGWWYIFDFIIAAMIIYLIYMVVIQKESMIEMADVRKDSKKSLPLLVLLCVFVSSLVFISIFTDVKSFSAFYTQPLSFVIFKQSAGATLWPNVYTTVAELNEASLEQIIAIMGGKLMFAVSIVGVLLTLTLKREGKLNFRYAILLIIWYAGTMYASTKGIRFTMLLAPAFIIAVGSAMGILYKYLSAWAVKGLNINKDIVNTLLIVVLALLLIGPVKAANDTTKSQVPSMNDGWYNALTKIKLNSTDDAIINSWWDFGHWFKAIADRRVTSDGASQNSPQAHWVGRVLLTSNEDEAIGILRMLDCGANLAFDTLKNITNNTHKSVDMLYDVVPLDKDKARMALEKNTSAENADSVLRYTHCDPPEDYFITSEDMVGKAGVWAHFGSWDFERALIWRELRKEKVDEAVKFMVDNFGYPEEKARNLYYEVQSITDEREANSWISPWPGYAGTAQCPNIDNRTVQCVFGIGGQTIPFQIDTKNMEAVIETTTGKVYPASMSYVDEKNNFAEKKYENNTIPYSIALIRDGDRYKSVIMSPELAASIFTRLFYFNGAGLKHFDKFEHQVDITGQNIIVWKIDWEGKK